MEMRSKGLIAGSSALATVVVVAVVLAMRPGGDSQIAPLDDSASPEPPPPAEQFPPPPVVAAVAPLPVVPAKEDGAALCDGCLTERAVLDVVETYLRHLDPVYLHGEMWAHPLADIAPDPPGQVAGQPKLSPELVDAPELNPMGLTVDARSYPVETTWIVWVQDREGWVTPQSIENQVRTGILPEVALSWPPIKSEVFVAVDGRTGEFWPDGIFSLTSMGIQPPYPPHYEAVLDATRERAARWIRGGGSDLPGSP